MTALACMNPDRAAPACRVHSLTLLKATLLTSDSSDPIRARSGASDSRSPPTSWAPNQEGVCQLRQILLVILKPVLVPHGSLPCDDTMSYMSVLSAQALPLGGPGAVQAREVDHHGLAPAYRLCSVDGTCIWFL